MKLTRYRNVFALSLTFSLAFASPALAQAEFCVVLDLDTYLVKADPSLVGQRVPITVNGTSAYGEIQSNVITATNTAACFKINYTASWLVKVSTNGGIKFVMGVARNPASGNLDVYQLHLHDFWNKPFTGHFGVPPNFVGLPLNGLVVTPAKRDDQGVYRVTVTPTPIF